MNTAGKLSDHVETDRGVLDADITTDRFSAWFSMEAFRRAIAHLQTGTVADTKVATVGFEQATSSGGASAKALGTDTSKTASGAEVLTLTREIDVSDMDVNNDFDHIRIKVTSDDPGAVIGSAVLIRDTGRF